MIPSKIRTAHTETHTRKRENAKTLLHTPHLELLQLIFGQRRDPIRNIAVVRRSGRGHELEAAEGRVGLHEPHRAEYVVRLERLSYIKLIKTDNHASRM